MTVLAAFDTSTYERQKLSVQKTLLSQDIMHRSNSLLMIHIVFFLNCSHLLKKKTGYSPGRPLLRHFVRIWPIKLNNKLQKITQYDTR